MKYSYYFFRIMFYILINSSNKSVSLFHEVIWFSWNAVGYVFDNILFLYSTDAFAYRLWQACHKIYAKCSLKLKEKELEKNYNSIQENITYSKEEQDVLLNWLKEMI